MNIFVRKNIHKFFLGKIYSDIYSRLLLFYHAQYIGIFILCCICHFPFVFILQRIFRRLQVIILPTTGNVKRHITGQRRPIFNCSLQLQPTVDSGTPHHSTRSSTVHCQSDLLGTVENTVFAGRWCGFCPILPISMVTNILGYSFVQKKDIRPTLSQTISCTSSNMTIRQCALKVMV